MESRKRSGRGWLALAAIMILPLLGLYVGAYYALVIPARWTKEDAVWDALDQADGRNSWEDPQEQEEHEQMRRGFAMPVYRYSWRMQRLISLKRFFRPIHAVDRAYRPQAWGPLPVPR